MNDLNQIKITPRDQQILDLLVQGCDNKEIAARLGIEARTVKQHLRTLFLRAGITEGRKRVKLATALAALNVSVGGQLERPPQLAPKEIKVATLVSRGMSNRDIASEIGTSTQVVKNYLRTVYDRLGVWTRLELALYIAGHGGEEWAAQLSQAS